jgi:hypothetical protein
VLINLFYYMFIHDIAHCPPAAAEIRYDQIINGIDVVSRILEVNVCGEQSHSFSSRTIFLRRIKALYAVTFAMQFYGRTADDLL